MKKNSIIFLDWDGTLCWSRFWESLRIDGSPLRKFGEKIEDLLFSRDRTLLNEWMRGKRNSEQINILLCEQLSIDQKELWNIFVQDCKRMYFDDKLQKKIEQIRTQSYVILVTGNVDGFSRFTVPALGLENIFDQIINSSALGYLKTEKEGETFLACLRLYGIPITDTFLIDDSAKACDFFSSLGGQSYIVRDGKNDTLRFMEDIYQTLAIKPIDNFRSATLAAPCR